MYDCYEDDGSLSTDMSENGYRIKVNVKNVDSLTIDTVDDPCTNDICN